MANINEILARAAALRDETALNSISPERAGSIMYDTLIALNDLWLQQGAALVISKIYTSVAAMEADAAPVSDLTGEPLRPGQIVVIASSDSDNGSVYRYNGTESPSWALVGNIGNLEPVDSLDSDSTSLPLAAHQGKVLDGKIVELDEKIDGKIVELVSISPSGANANVTTLGGKYFNSNLKKVCTCTDVGNQTFTQENPKSGVLYLCESRIYVWDGSDLVSKLTEQVIPIVAFSSSSPLGLSKGQYYYNTSTKKLYQNNGGTIYSNREVTLSLDALYIYNKAVYIWNGNDLVMANYDTIFGEISQYIARVAVDNTTPLALSASDFQNGNIDGSTGANIQSDRSYLLRTIGYIELVGGETLAYSINNGYEVDFHYYNSDKTYRGHTDWKSGTGSVVVNQAAKYLRLVLRDTSQGTISFDNTGISVTPSKAYEYTRAAAASEVNRLVNEAIDGYFSYELPIIGPSPQLPANDSPDSDFNAETVTSEDIYDAIDGLMDEIQFKPEFPKILTKYDVQGTDESGDYKINTYVFSLRNRYAWRAADELYAWKDGSGNVVFVDSCSPRVGDTIYSSSSRSNSGKTVASYDSSTGTMVDSSSTSFTRDSDDNVSALMIWTTRPYRASLDLPGSTLTAFNEDGTQLGSATVVDSSHLSFGGNSYERSECFDYHTDQIATIFLWANEHGPTSDPLEPSIIFYRMMKDLCYGCRNNPFLMFLKKYCKIVFIPCANPWGCQYPRVEGRRNYNGVNINRNYDTPGWSSQSDSDKGSYAGDQNETQYIMNMCLRFGADLAIDGHCHSFGVIGNQATIITMGTRPVPVTSFASVMSGYGMLFSYGSEPEPETRAEGLDWIYYNGIAGGLYEMTAGKYAAGDVYDGGQHTASVMDANYTELLNSIRLWLYQSNPDLDLSKMSIK